MIPNQKHLFNMPADVTYLNCAYMGPQLKSISEEGKKSIVIKEQPWKLDVNDFFDPPEKLKALFAQIINGQSDQVALIPSVSYGIETAVKNVAIEAGSEIVVLAEQFPSNIYPWMEAAKANNARLVTIARPQDEDWTGAILESIKKETAVVALPQAHWTDGSFIDLAQIRKRCDEVGAALVIDGTQSVGACPFDVKKIRPDFLISAAYKWLLGPYSMAYLYVDKKYQSGRPLEFGWMGRAGSRDFSKLVNYTNKFEPDASRFDVGEKSNFVLLPMAIKSLEQIVAWGVENIYETLSALTQYAGEKANQAGLTVAPIPKRAGHFMGIKFKDGVPENLIHQLKRDKIIVSVRGNSIRVAPHLYNCTDDFDRLFEVISGQ